MLLDAILLLKEKDESLSFRRSCREGVCGSDAMNINGRNGLACITPLASLKQPIKLNPLPGMPVVRDLIVDMEPFYKQYRSVKPWLMNDEPEPDMASVTGIGPTKTKQDLTRRGSASSSSYPFDH